MRIWARWQRLWASGRSPQEFNKPRNAKIQKLIGPQLVYYAEEIDRLFQGLPEISVKTKEHYTQKGRQLAACMKVILPFLGVEPFICRENDGSGDCYIFIRIAT